MLSRQRVPRPCGILQGRITRLPAHHPLNYHADVRGSRPSQKKRRTGHPPCCEYRRKSKAWAVRPPEISADRFPATAPCHGRQHVKQNSRPSFHFLHSDALIVPMFGISFFLGGHVGIEPVSVDAQRPVALVLG